MRRYDAPGRPGSDTRWFDGSSMLHEQLKVPVRLGCVAGAPPVHGRGEMELDDALRRLATPSPSKLDAAVDAVLASALRLVDADRVSLTLLGGRREVERVRALPGIPPRKPSSRYELAGPFVRRQLRSGRVLALSSVEELPSAGAADLRMLRRGGVRSALLVPLTADDGGVVAEIRFVTVTRLHRWTQSDTDLARRLGALLASALLRLEAEHAREAELRFVEVASAMAEGLFHLPPYSAQEAMRRALGLIAHRGGATQASAWQVQEGGRYLQLVAAAGGPRPPDRLLARTALPWLRPRLGLVAPDRPLLLSGPGELPTGAACPERELLERLHVRALVGVPLRAGGEWIGWMSIGRRRPGAWSRDIVRTLELLGPIVGGALRWTRDAKHLAQTELDLKRLTLQFLHVQDDERRRIARELHDGTAQHVAAASLEMARLARRAADPGDSSALLEAEGLCLQALKDLRTLSYLLHPPLLDEQGLVPALRWFASGFAARTGLEIAVKANGVARLPRHAEVPLFRVVQEALTNVYRHARARRVEIEVRQEGRHIVVSVADDGQGFRRGPKDILAGVGILGMRERLRQLGGTIRIVSGARRTLVRAACPLAPKASWR